MDIYNKIEYLADMFLKEAKKKKRPMWKNKPKGWDAGSVRQYADSLIGNEKHPFTKCVNKMKEHIDNPEAFCGKTKAILNDSKK